MLMPFSTSCVTLNFLSLIVTVCLWVLKTTASLLKINCNSFAFLSEEQKTSKCKSKWIPERKKDQGQIRELAGNCFS